MLEIMLQIVDDYMPQSASQQYAEKDAQHEVVEMVLEKYLQTRKMCSEDILFYDPMKKQIPYSERDEIENAVSIDIQGSDGKRYHDFFTINKSSMNVMYPYRDVICTSCVYFGFACN